MLSRHTRHHAARSTVPQPRCTVAIHTLPKPNKTSSSTQIFTLQIFKYSSACWQNCEKRLSASLWLSVRPRRTTRLPLEAFREIWLFIILRKFIQSFSRLSYDRSKASSKASSSHSAILSFLLQMRVSSPFLKVIQNLPTSSSSPSCHFYPPFYLSSNNPL